MAPVLEELVPCPLTPPLLHQDGPCTRGAGPLPLTPPLLHQDIWQDSAAPVLEELVRHHLPLLSTEHPAGSVEAGEYVALVAALCAAADTTTAFLTVSY